MTGPVQQLLAIVFCLAISALSASSETALVALGEARARQLVEEKGHRLLRLWLRFPERVIATLLIANNIVNTLSAALMTVLMSELGNPHAVAIATGVMTLLILAFGDITPKALARTYSAQLAPAVMPFVWLLYIALWPAVWVFSQVPKMLDRFLQRGKPASERATITPEEIEYLIDLGAKQGVLDREKGELLTSVLEFSDIVAREVMVPRMKIVALPSDATKQDVLKLIVESEHSRIPVYGESIDEIVGILHVKSFLADIEMGRLLEPFELRRYVKQPFFVPELMKISRLLREFQRRKTHLAVVVDEFGGTAGVVALEDVVEEIVGEIQDEYDAEEGRVKLLPDGTVVADAGMTLRDLEEYVGVDFPDELDYDSLGGFVTAQAGKVPGVGSVVLWQGLRFTVRAADERRVTRVEIVRTKDKDNGPPADASSPEAPHAADDSRPDSPRDSGA